MASHVEIIKLKLGYFLNHSNTYLVNNTKIESDQIELIKEDILHKQESINLLNLRANLIKEHYLIDLIKFLDFNFSLLNIQYLYLSGNSIGNPGAIIISEFLIKSSLKDIDLNMNNIKNEGAACLSEALKINKTLTLLYLNFNDITNQGAFALASGLKVNKSIKTFMFNSNKIREEASKRFPKIAKTNSSLKEIDIRNNRIAYQIILLNNKVAYK